MQHWLDNTRQHIQKGEAFITSSVSALFRGWQHPAILPAIVLDKLCTGAERWQAAIRQIQAPKDMAEILRSRSICNP
jgi:hypothetical protein